MSPETFQTFVGDRSNFFEPFQASGRECETYQSFDVFRILLLEGNEYVVNASVGE
jgi:hypothetical protein